MAHEEKSRTVRTVAEGRTPDRMDAHEKSTREGIGTEEKNTRERMAHLIDCFPSSAQSPPLYFNLSSFTRVTARAACNSYSSNT